MVTKGKLCKNTVVNEHLSIETRKWVASSTFLTPLIEDISTYSLLFDQS